ncbi:endoplasmic reticulum metallopeptidase 1-like isoform X1 [Schistocerca piceifrons]|uniref:endoplasmic reticulum metallopeptidase 1-like isoform X1 n=1 Tax=Schistocerca piceifrons TaxID=274613 RepID=UPI001F5FDD1F|nr:endoplasmic reticulum metallopeptidase 1-like isoform X1 [Schistocerca piceifrons]
MRNKEKENDQMVRQRVRNHNRDFLPQHHGTRTRNNKYLLPTPTSHLVIVLALLLVLCLLITYLEKQLPTPLMEEDAATHPGRFISERAMKDLVNLTSIGPRPTGSYENEVLAVRCLATRINKIIKDAKSSHKIWLDLQKTSGAFPLSFLDGMTNVYRNVQNIIVKVGPNSGSRHSLLMNCHFDTVQDSPGASDDGASCAVMLEIFRVITQRDEPLNNNLILLFNGGEENLMEASHGFITKHKWAKEVRAFINLEACGAGGREVLFQAGPNNPWLMQKYSESVPYPYASSLAQEIFQSGIIPGDTDFRIFRDFGHIPGLDFAWSTNGYVYHTKYDNVEQIPLGTLQRTGDNILALTLNMINSQEIVEAELHSEGNLIFFDFLGAFIVRWSQLLNRFMNIIAVAFSVYTLKQNMIAATDHDVKKNVYWRHLCMTAVSAICSWLLGILACITIAVILTSIGCTMSWYARPVWIFFLYISPALAVPMAFILGLSHIQRKVFSSPWTVFQLYCDGYQIAWTLILTFCTLLSVRSGFVAWMWTFFPCIVSLLQRITYRRWRDWKWLVLHVGVILLPFCQCFYLILGAMGLYIPIMGRAGSGNYSEIVLAGITSAMFVLLFSFITPLILLVRRPTRILSLFGGLSLVAIILLILTPLGFPYSGDPASPAPQRFMIAHTKQVFHDSSGREYHHESGYWLVDMDVNSPQSVKSIVPHIEQAKMVHTSSEECRRQLYCGFPYLLPVITFLGKTHWIPAPDPPVPIPVTLKLVSKENIGKNLLNMTFTVTGPDHMGIMMAPANGFQLQSWSFVEGEPLVGPKWNERDTYFIYYGCASEPVPWTFWIILKGEGRINETLDIAVTSHFLHGLHKTSPGLDQLLQYFPSWTTVSAWVATYSSWKF